MRKIFLTLLVVSLVFSNTFTKKYNKEIEHILEKTNDSNYNKNYCILIDYNLHSSFNRLFVVDLNNKRIIKGFKVLHSRGGSKYFSLRKGFSNEVGSNKSSLGFSVIQFKSNSNWGNKYNYRLKGLSKTNSNINKRNIVLHSWGGVPNIGLFPIPLPQSQGCPTISNKALTYIDNLIKGEKNKNILIYAFNEK
jgi:hypothetical protein